MWKKKAETKNPQSTEKAYEYAVFLLGIRLRTEGELREKLRIRDYELRITDKVIKQLKDLRYIDDQRYAEIFLDNLKKYKSWGYYGIKKKMMEKRLPPSIVESVLSEGLSEEEEQKIAERYLKKQETGDKIRDKKPRYQIPTNRGRYGAQQKIAQKLRAKGFRGGVIVKAVF